MARRIEQVLLVAAAVSAASVSNRVPVAWAQPAVSAMLAPGTRLRVWLAYEIIEGTFQSQHDDSLVVRFADSGSTRTVALRQVWQLQFSRGHHGHALTGLGIGALAGALVGGMAGSAACEGDMIVSQGACVGITTMFGIPTGAVLGAIVGALVTSDRWEDAPIEALASRAQVDKLRVTPSYAAGTVGLNLRISF